MKEQPKVNLKKGILLSIISTLTTCLLLEVGIRSYDAVRGIGFFSTNRNVFYQPFEPIRPFRTFGDDLYTTVNNERYISSRTGQLFPIEKPANTYRIVTFGGSTTEQIIDGVDYPKILQTLLQDRVNNVNIEVINVAHSAYATPHFLVLLELDVLSWDPDLVILSENINDLTAMYFPDFTYDYSNKFSNEFYGLPDYDSRYTATNVLFQHFQLYWVVKNATEKISNQRIANDTSRIRRISYGDEPNPTAQAVFERNLRTFVTIAKANGIDVVLATQPYQADEDYFVKMFSTRSYLDVVQFPFQDEFIKHFDAYNDSIEKISVEQDVFFVDNDLIFGGEKEYFIDTVHYTSDGLNLLANSYADYICNNILTVQK